jgi:hypothetical protein
MGFAYKSEKAWCALPFAPGSFISGRGFSRQRPNLKLFFGMLLENAKTFDLFKKAALWKNQTPSRVLQTTSVLVFSNGRAKDI